MNEPFTFYTESGIVRWTGLKADNLRDMLDGLEKVSGSSIFYHMHHCLFRQHFTTSDFMNDFARWIFRVLHEDRLSEKLSSIDLLDYTSIRQAREVLIGYIREHLGHMEYLFRVPVGHEFYFCEKISFVLKTGVTVRTLEEFLEGLKKVDIGSVFYHLIEARLRLKTKSNDFSEWLRNSLGEDELADWMMSLNPYNYNLWQIKSEMAKAIKARLKQK